MRNAGLEEAQAGTAVLPAGGRLLGEISINSDMEITPHLWQEVKN